MTQHLPRTPEGEPLGVGRLPEDPLAFDLRDRLRKSLQVSGHNPHSLAGAMGVHPNTISNYLAGRTRPSRPVLTAWAVAIGGYGVTAEWLEFGWRAPAGHPPTPDQAVGPADRRDELAREKRRRRGEDFTDGSGDSDTRRYNEVLQPTG